MRHLKEEEEEIAGSQDDRYPEGRNIQGIPCTKSELATKLFGIFESKPSGGISNGCDNIVTLSSMISNTSAQDCTAVTGLGELQAIGGHDRLGQGILNAWRRDEGLGLASHGRMKGRAANERGEQRK